MRSPTGIRETSSRSSHIRPHPTPARSVSMAQALPDGRWYAWPDADHAQSRPRGDPSAVRPSVGDRRRGPAPPLRVLYLPAPAPPAWRLAKRSAPGQAPVPRFERSFSSAYLAYVPPIRSVRYLFSVGAFGAFSGRGAILRATSQSYRRSFQESTGRPRADIPKPPLT